MILDLSLAILVIRFAQPAMRLRIVSALTCGLLILHGAVSLKPNAFVYLACNS